MNTNTKRPKLTMLKPSLAVLDTSRGAALPRDRNNEPSRIRGRKLQEIRERHRRLQPLCMRCKEKGRVKPWDELDHKVALMNGGTDTDDNREGLCREHHLEKTQLDLRIHREAGGGFTSSGSP